MLKAPNQGILRVGFLRGNLSLEVGTVPWVSRGLSSVQVRVPRAGECPPEQVSVSRAGECPSCR